MKPRILAVAAMGMGAFMFGIFTEEIYRAAARGIAWAFKDVR
jgi:hypothetical protein